MKKASLPLRNLVVLSKKWYRKKMISAAKTLKKFKNIESPKMVSKRLYGHYLRSYEQIMKNRFFDKKGVSAPQKLVNFPKKCKKKTMITAPKT